MNAVEEKFAERCVQPRSSRAGLDEHRDDDLKNCGLFWRCSSYDEYMIKCTVEGIEPLWTRSEFDSMEHFSGFECEVDVANL